MSNTPRTCPQHTPGPSEWTYADLVEHLQLAMHVELSTIPLYLYAVWSIKTDTEEGQNAARKILHISGQEMQHLSLAGNVLSSIGEDPKLYYKAMIPVYDDRSHLLEDEIRMRLQVADDSNILRFRELEKPAPQSDEKTRRHLSANLICYKSIGEFYEYLMDGVHKIQLDFNLNQDKQFAPSEFKTMVVIENKDIALSVLTRIIEEGEGDMDTPNSHYATFRALYSSYAKKPWKYQQVPLNPYTAGYKEAGLPFIYKVSLTFDALYCYILQCMEQLWITAPGNARDKFEQNIHSIMKMLSTLATILTTTPLQEVHFIGQTYAAPCFNFYGNPNGEPYGVNELYSSLQMEISDAINLAVDTVVRDKLAEVQRAIEDVAPPN